jgi:hypothetical protein
MVMANIPLAAGTSFAPAVAGLAGALIGGVIAGGASLMGVRQAQRAAERAWIRDNRRAIYDRFLTCGQMLLVACEAYKEARPEEKAEKKANVESVFANSWGAYSVLETVADTPLFDTARIYGYRLWELVTELGSTSVMGPENFDAVRELILSARRHTIAAMRGELGLENRSASDINPFAGTSLEEKYADSERPRPGRLTL